MLSANCQPQDLSCHSACRCDPNSRWASRGQNKTLRIRGEPRARQVRRCS